MNNRQWSRWFMRVGLGSFVLVALLAGLAWLNRAQIAGRVLASQCATRGVSCSADFTVLTPERIRLDGLRVESAGDVPVEINTLELDLDWPRFLAAQVTRVNVTQPTIRGAYLDGEFGLYGLEDVFAPLLVNDGASSGSSAPLAQVEISGGRIIAVTEAGEVSGEFEMSGEPLRNGTVSISITPVELERDGARLSLLAGELALVFTDGAINGHVDLAIGSAELAPVALGSAKLTGVFEDDGGQTNLSLNAQIVELSGPGMQVGSAEIQAASELSHPETFDAPGILQVIETVAITAEVEAFSSEQAQITRGEMSLDMRRTEAGLEGPAALSMIEVRSAAFGADEASGAGDLRVEFSGTPAYSYLGSLILRGASVSETLQNELFASVQLPEPFGPHGQQLRAHLVRASDSFDVGLDLDADYRGDVWALEAGRATLLQSASGLQLGLDPYPGQPWFRASPTEVLVQGRMSLKGTGGFPALDGGLDELSFTDEGLSLRTRSVVLGKWSAAGRTVSAQFEQLDVNFRESIRVLANGELRLSGDFPGLTLQDTRLQGRVSALQADEGWRVQTENASCVRFSTAGLEAGAVRFDPVILSLCPEDGRFIHQENGRAVGRLSLGDIAWPFQVGTISGVLGLDGPGLQWYTGDGFRLFLNGQRFHLPLNLSGETFSIDAATPEMIIGLGNGPPSISAELAETLFDGTLVPADVVARDFSFAGVVGEGGIEGALRSAQIAIADMGADPVYQPLIADLSATLARGVLKLDGDVSAARTGLELADVAMNLQLADLEGAAHVRMAPLMFVPEGLQPADLSELLRGVLTNASGQVSGEADIVISNGKATGTGHVVLDELAFDTLKVGTVTGVNGRIEIADLFSATTSPGQRLSIDHIDPGVPLDDGELRFHLTGGTMLGLESARWPFAGGELVASPAVWRMGSLDPIEVQIHASELTLERLIEVFQVPDLVAQGTVSGTFPIQIEGANLMVRSAVLAADDKGGKIAYSGSAVEAIRGSNSFADFAIDALKDFDFSVMEIGADGNLIGNLLVTAKVQGKSEDVLDGTEFIFSLGLDSNLSQLLRTLPTSSSDVFSIEALQERFEVSEPAPEDAE